MGTSVEAPVRQCTWNNRIIAVLVFTLRFAEILEPLSKVYVHSKLIISRGKLFFLLGELVRLTALHKVLNPW